MVLYLSMLCPIQKGDISVPVPIALGMIRYERRDDQPAQTTRVTPHVYIYTLPFRSHQQTIAISPLSSSFPHTPIDTPPHPTPRERNKPRTTDQSSENPRTPSGIEKDPRKVGRDGGIIRYPARTAPRLHRPHTRLGAVSQTAVNNALLNV